MDSEKIKIFIEFIRQMFAEHEGNRGYQNDNNMENAVFLFKEIFKNED